MEEAVTFKSGDLTLSGVVHTPDDMAADERRPAIVVLHGFGSRKNAGNVTGPAAMFSRWGYVVLRFDMRGCGDSEGLFGHLLCLDQVEDPGGYGDKRQRPPPSEGSTSLWGPVSPTRAEQHEADDGERCSEGQVERKRSSDVVEVGSVAGDHGAATNIDVELPCSLDPSA